MYVDRVQRVPLMFQRNFSVIAEELLISFSSCGLLEYTESNCAEFPDFSVSAGAAVRIHGVKCLSACMKCHMWPIASFCCIPLKHIISYRYGLPTVDTTFEGTPEDMTGVDAAALRRQVPSK